MNKRLIDPSIARQASAGHYHCDLSSLDPQGQHEDLGPFNSLGQMVAMTGKSIEQWRAERKQLAQAKLARKLARQRGKATPTQTKSTINIFEMLRA